MTRPPYLTRRRLACLFLTAVAIAPVAALLSHSHSLGPSYAGKPLRQWLHGHPKDYVPAVHAIGTNAIPFLLSELQSHDSLFGRAAERTLGRLEIGPLWETAQHRKYYARIALQILDTNAVPALLDAAFRLPFRLQEGHRSWESAAALGWLASPEAKEQIQHAITLRLQSAVPEDRRSACLVCYASGIQPNLSAARLLVEHLRDQDAHVRAAATRALCHWQTNESEVIPALIARLDDEQVAIRRLAIDALVNRESNAVVALPALRAAYSNELSRPRRTDNLDEIYQGTQVLSTNETRWALRYAIRQLDPNAKL